MNIREIIDQYHEIQNSLDKWISEELEPMLKECKTLDEVDALKKRIIELFSGSPADFRFPSEVEICFAVHMVSIKRKMKIKITARELMDRGFWDKACEVTGLNPWCCNEGLMSSDEEITLTEEEAKEIGIK